MIKNYKILNFLIKVLEYASLHTYSPVNLPKKMLQPQTNCKQVFTDMKCNEILSVQRSVEIIS